MQAYGKLQVWRDAMAFSLAVAKVADGMPAKERYCLEPQLRRASASVFANIAEGAHRANPGDYAKYLNIAQGSLAEVESFLIFARERQYVAREEVARLLSEASVLGGRLERLRQAVLQSGKRSAPAAS